MNLATRELRRRPNRFITATVILTLIALLLLFLGGLLDGLINSSTGALRAQPEELVVTSSTAENSFVRSRITPELRAEIEAVEGVGRVGGLGVSQLGARVPGNAPRDLADVAVIGYELAPEGVPDPPPDGEGIADEVLKADGVEEGMTIEVGPARTPLTIVGFSQDTSYSGQGSVWTSAATWREVQNANRPDAPVGDDLFQALVVGTAGEGDGGPDPENVAASIDEATGGATTTLTVEGTIEALPGVSQQRSVFNQIIGVTVVIAVVVVALFFALITVERTALYGVLKAVGARSGTLFRGLVVQAVTVTLIASAIGVGIGLALDAAVPAGSIPFDLSITRIALSVGLLLVAAVIGCAFSLRRVLRIDPASAIGSAT